jgi:hypothetical protein
MIPVHVSSQILVSKTNYSFNKTTILSPILQDIIFSSMKIFISRAPLVEMPTI